MAKFECSHDILNEHIRNIKKEQGELVRVILIDNGQGMGGLIGAVSGKNGRYELESIHIDGSYSLLDEDSPIICHLDYPAFEVDVDFDDLSIDERQQIIDMLIAELQK